MEAVSLSNALFSKVQQRVLGLIFGRPERSFYMSEVVRAVRSRTGAVGRELSRLQRSGLVSVERIGNQKHYRANRNSPIFHELQSLVVKTVVLSEPLRQALAPWSDRIKAAFVFGSVAKGRETASNDIDLAVIGDELNYSDLYTALEDAQSALRRKVSPVFFSPKDWNRKASDTASFVSKMASQPKSLRFRLRASATVMSTGNSDVARISPRFSLRPAKRGEGAEVPKGPRRERGAFAPSGRHCGGVRVPARLYVDTDFHVGIELAQHRNEPIEGETLQPCLTHPGEVGRCEAG
jgi:predicted nucleotidyltransferase